MSRRRKSSSSQTEPWSDNYTWEPLSNSAVDECWGQLNDLSLSPSLAAANGTSTPRPTYWGSSVGSTVPATISPASNALENPASVSEYVDQLPGYWIPNDSEVYSVSTTAYRQMGPSIEPYMANDNSLNPLAESISSTHVSPSSSAPSKRSTMDEWHIGDVVTVAEPNTAGGKPRRDKKKSFKPRAYKAASRRKGGGTNAFILTPDSPSSPYPRVLAEADLYDVPTSSSNGTGFLTGPYVYPSYQAAEDEWDMCDRE